MNFLIYIHGKGWGIMDDLVSIIIPIYNMDKYIEKCINSTLKQTYRNIEVILVDDGSVDKSNVICEKYKKIDNRVRVIHKENKGLVSARKSGLEISNGDYIVPLDADDWLDEKMIEEMMQIIIREKIEMAQCSIIWEYLDGGVLSDDNIIEGEYNLDKLDNSVYKNLFVNHKEQSKNGMRLNICSCIFERNLLIKSQKCVPDELANGEDDALFFIAMLQAKKFYKFSYPYYHALVRCDSMSRSARMFGVEQVFMIESVVRPFLECHKFREYIEPGFNRYLLNLFAFYMKMKFKLSFQRAYTVDLLDISKKSKLVIYGVGIVGQSIYKEYKNQYNIVALIDANKKNLMEEKIYRVDTVANLVFDYIILASVSESIRHSMYRELMKFGIPDEKIINREPILSNDDRYYIFDSNY